MPISITDIHLRSSAANLRPLQPALSLIEVVHFRAALIETPP